MLAKLGSAYFVFKSTFYATREAKRNVFRAPTLEHFCDSLIREKDKILHLGVISTVSTSNKALVAQQKDKFKHPKKQYPRNNKKNKGSQTILASI
jgi:hypothetical protein